MDFQPVRHTISLYRNAYRGLSRATWLLSLVMLVNRSGTMVLPFMTIYLTSPRLGYSLGQAGVVVGLFGAGAICGGLLGGRLTDRFGFRRVQLFALTGGGLLFILLGQLKSYPLICVGTFLLSFVNDAFRPANSTATAAYSTPENRTRSFSLNRLATNLGWAFGGSLGGFIAAVDYRALFWVDGCTNLFAAFLLFRLLAPAEPANGHIPGEEKAVLPLQRAWRDRGYLAFIALTILFAVCFVQSFSVAPVFYKRGFHMSEAHIGLLLGLNGAIIVLVEMLLVFHLETRNQARRYIVVGILLTGISFALLNLFPPVTATAILSVICLTFGEMFAMPFLNSFWIARTTDANRGQYAGLYTMAWSAAQVIGPTGGSFVAEHAGFRVLWWIVAGLCAVTAFAFRLARLG